MTPPMTKPVTLPPYVVAHLSSGRVRAVALPYAAYRRVEPDCFLWVKEGVEIPHKQTQRDALSIIYAGERWVHRHKWPAALAKPGPGSRPAEAMPRNLSRFTLIVAHVQHLRLKQIGENDAIACGVQPDEGGFGVLWEPRMRPFENANDAMQFLYHKNDLTRSEDNPEVALVQFRASSRNVNDHIAGLA